jgi:hypothetical protein
MSNIFLFSFAGACPVTVFVLEGKAGLPGRGGGPPPFIFATLDADTVCLNGTFGTSSSLTFFSGSGGKLAGSYSGALTLLYDLSPFTLGLFSDIADIDDRPDATEDILSTDCFRPRLCSEPRLGGKIGVPFSDDRRGGNGGLATPVSRPSHFFITGAGSTSFCVGGGGGGFLPFVLPPAGVFPMPFVPLLLNVDGLFVLCGLFGNGGGGRFDFTACS